MCLSGIAWNHRQRREIIRTIRCIKLSYYTQFASILAMSGVTHCIIHIHFTQYIYTMSSGYLLLFEMIKFLPILLITCPMMIVMYILLWQVFGGGLSHYIPGISHHLPLIRWLGRRVTSGDSIALIGAPPTAVKLVIGMLSLHLPMREDVPEKSSRSMSLLQMEEW